MEKVFVVKEKQLRAIFEEWKFFDTITQSQNFLSFLESFEIKELDFDELEKEYVVLKPE